MQLLTMQSFTVKTIALCCDRWAPPPLIWLAVSIILTLSSIKNIKYECDNLADSIYLGGTCVPQCLTALDKTTKLTFLLWPWGSQHKGTEETDNTTTLTAFNRNETFGKIHLQSLKCSRPLAHCLCFGNTCIVAYQ